MQDRHFWRRFRHSPWLLRLSALGLVILALFAIERAYAANGHALGFATVHAVLWIVGVGGLVLSALVFVSSPESIEERQEATRRNPVPAIDAGRGAAESEAPRQMQQTDLNKPDVDGLLKALELAGYGLLRVDDSLRVRWLNRTAEGMTGWPLKDAIGQLAYTVCHIQDDAGEQQPTPAERVLEQRGGNLQRLTGWLLPRNGGQPLAVDCVATLQHVSGRAQALMWLQSVTERRRGQQASQARAQRAEAIVNELAEAVLVTDETGQVRGANARALRMFGYSRDEILQQTVARLMPVPFMNAPEVKFTEYRTTPSRQLPRAVAWRKDATHFPAELVVEPLPEIDGARQYVAIVRDVSERLRSVNLAQRLGRLLDSAQEEVYIFDAYSLYFLEVNRGARRNLGYSEAEMRSLTPLMISDGLTPEEFQGYLARLRGGEAEHLVYRARHKRADGSVYPVEVRLNFSRDEEPPVFMAIAADIAEREAEEREMSRLANFDTLTGLPNRTQLYQRMQVAMATAREGPRQLAVMFLDLDRFKSINDDYGHDVGDAVLKGIAERLNAALRSADTAARLSGDEFVVLAEGIRGVSDAEVVIHKLQEQLKEPLQCGEHRIELLASIGVTLYPEDDADMETLLRHADEAMYQAKRKQRGSYRFYSARHNIK